jgi:hypothetical protein
MPPRYAYWTILIDNKPTAFRAREKEEVLPTFHQLRRTNTDVVLKWFARGRLWETPEAAEAAGREAAAAREKRGSDWRPGGAHKDPRDRFTKSGKRPHESSRPPAAAGVPRDSAPGATRRPRPWRAKPGALAPRGDRPWRERPDAQSQGGVRPRSPLQPPREAPVERREADPKVPRDQSGRPSGSSGPRRIKLG